MFTFLPRQAAEPPLSPGSLLYALNCFNMSEYMSDEHVALASDFARKILRKRCDGERIASGVHPEKPITGPARKVRQRCCPCSIADSVFSPLTPCRQSCCGNRIAPPCCGNRIAPSKPGVGTGLPLQSCCANRIASPIPVLATGLPRCTTSSSGLELFLPEHRLVMESAPL